MKRLGTNTETIQAFISQDYTEGKSDSGNVFFEKDTLFSYGYHFPLAVRRNGYYIVNGDRYSTTTAKHQSILFHLLSNDQRLEIPFSALNVMARTGGRWQVSSIALEINVLDWEADRYLDTGRLDKYGNPIYDHVLGGALFAWNGKVLVSGMDLSGTGPRGRFFLTELDKGQIERYGEPTTYYEAIDTLKPDIVKRAEKHGVHVYRQGEWFFIREGLIQRDSEDIVKNFALQHKDSRANAAHVASEGFVWAYRDESALAVRGIIKHVRKEHKQLKLYDDVKEKDWFFAYESVQGQSWAAGGNVD